MALCAAALPAGAKAPLPREVSGPAHRHGGASLALASDPTPTRDTGGVTAPLPRGNPGDPAARERLEQGEGESLPSAEAGTRAEDREAKGGADSAQAAQLRDLEGK